MTDRKRKSTAGAVGRTQCVPHDDASQAFDRAPDRKEGTHEMKVSTLTHAARRPIVRDARGFALALALLFGVVGVGSHAPSIFQDRHGTAAAAPDAQPVDGTCDDGLAETDEQPWVRSELFFGTAKPDGTAVTAAEWRAFLDGEITPRFPDGLTVMTGIGQWQEADEEIVQERSMLLILLYPREAAAASGAKIEEIRAAYEQRFRQESVLRADDGLPVCTSF
jgi:Protein of unknown function (DUF3574)